MKYLAFILLFFMTANNAYTQESTAFEDYLKKVKSPVYLDLQAGATPLIFDYDVTGFYNLSGGVQINQNIGVGVDYIKGRVGNAYSFIPFNGTGLQLRFTTHRWIVKGTFGKINSADLIDDSYNEYEYVPTKNDTYWRVDAGIRFWKVMSFNVSVLNAQNVFLDVFEMDYYTDELIYRERWNYDTEGIAVTLGVLLPPFGKKE